MFSVLLVAGLVWQPVDASADPIQIYAAGRLKPAMHALISESGLPAGDFADALLYYCSGARDLLKDVEGLTNLPVPENLDVHPAYGLAILRDNPEAARFGLFILSTRGQSILARFGFRPIAQPD